MLAAFNFWMISLGVPDGAMNPDQAVAAYPGNPASATFVGYDGEVYLDVLDDRNTLQVSTADGRCQVAFDYPATSAPIPRIGPLTCIPETSR